MSEILVRVKMTFVISDKYGSADYNCEAFVKVDNTLHGINAIVEKLAFDDMTTGRWFQDGMKIESYRTTLMEQV